MKENLFWSACSLLPLSLFAGRVLSNLSCDKHQNPPYPQGEKSQSGSKLRALHTDIFRKCTLPLTGLGHRPYPVRSSLFLLLFATCLAKADDDPYQCHQTETPIRLDGKGDDPAWRYAREIPNFVLPWENPPRKANSSTRAKLLWDDKYLYYFATMTDGDLQATRKERDGELWLDDVFELFFKPSESNSGYYEFQANPLGAMLDIFYPARDPKGYQLYKNKDKFGHTAKVIINGTLNQPGDKDAGWQVEGRIPWTDFKATGGKPEIGDEWRFTLCRYDYDPRFKNKQAAELSVSASSMIKSFHAHEHYPPIRYAGLFDPRTALPENLQKIRGIDTKVIGTPEPPLPYRAEAANPDHPISRLITFKFEPDTKRMIYVDQPPGSKGSRLMRRLDNGESEVLIDEPDETFYSLVFHPKFAENGQFFLSHFGPASAERKERRVQVRRFTMSRDKAARLNLDEAEVIIEWETWGHTGGAMGFDDEGIFYVTTGDGTGDSDTKLAGQDLSHLLAKMLRIDVEHPADGKAYSVPKDNPFTGEKSVRAETFAYGLRNPWRMSWDKKLKRFWVGNNGQDRFEQVYLIERGANYGWSVYEGSELFYGDRKRGPHPISLPTLEHDHGVSRSLTGGMIYEGNVLPGLRGAYIYGDHSTGKIWAARHDGKKVTWKAEIADTQLKITDFGVDPKSGDLLVSSHSSEKDGGGVYKLIPNPPDADAPPFPMTLSATGLFENVAKHKVRSELLPYEVIIPQWADGAEFEQYLALPSKETNIGFTPRRGWNFPDGTLVFQTLTREGKRLETRLIKKENKEWSAYSYAWNDAQTDAELVPAFGGEIDLGNGRKWKIPSRVDCLNCHSRAANFVLGLQASQMNRDHDYGGGFVENQLKVIDDLGFFLRPGVAKRTSLMRDAPEKYDHLADPFDEKNPDLDARARSYLHARCSHCHVESGGGNSMMDLRAFIDDPEKFGVIGVVPNHGDQGLNSGDIKIVSPGNPAKSVLFNRISKSGPGQMPPIGAETPDPRGLGILLQWILGAKVEEK